MDHDLHELVLLGLGDTVLGELLDTLADAIDERFDVLDLNLGVGDEMLGVLVDPSLASGQKLVNEVLGVDLEPSDVVRLLHSTDVVLDGVEEFNLLVELNEVGLSGGDVLENLVLEELVAGHRLLHEGVLFLGVVSLVFDLLLGLVDVLEVLSTVEEFSEGLLDVVLPEEVAVSVLVQELVG
jgi:hypothetical protein